MGFPLFSLRREQPVDSVRREQPVDSPRRARSGGTATRRERADGGDPAYPVGLHAYAREAAALLLIASALYVTLALGSFHGDPMRPEIVGSNWVGPVGAAFAGALVEAVGVGAWLIPLELVLLAAPLLDGRPSTIGAARLGGDIVIVVVLAAL